MIVWMLCMGALLAAAIAPLAFRRCHAEGYPMTLRIAVGLALVVLSGVFPAGEHWMTGLAMIGLAGVAPIVVDALLDHAPAGSPVPYGTGQWDGDGGAGAACSVIAATSGSGSW